MGLAIPSSGQAVLVVVTRELKHVIVGWVFVLEIFGFLTRLGGDLINVINCSSDNGLAKGNSRFRSAGMTPLGNVFCVAEASHSSTKGFNLRFVCYVACAPRFSTSGCESTTFVAPDSVCCFCTNPKHAVGNRQGSASSEEFRIAFLWKGFVSFDGLFGKL